MMTGQGGGYFSVRPVLIDAEVFDGLLDLIGAEALTDIMDSSRRQFAAARPVLAAALAAQDLRTLHHTAHDLKSSALNIGLRDLGALARDIETACRMGRDDDALRLGETVFPLLDEACTALDGMIGPKAN